MRFCGKRSVEKNPLLEQSGQHFRIGEQIKNISIQMQHFLVMTLLLLIMERKKIMTKSRWVSKNKQKKKGEKYRMKLASVTQN